MIPNKPSLPRFILWLLAFNLVLMSFVQLSNHFNLFPLPVKEVSWSFVFFSLINLGVFLLASYSRKQKDIKLSVTVLFAGIGFRLLFSVAYLLIYVYLYGKEERNFILSFVGFYILYTLFEIVYLKSNLRPDFEPKAKTDEAR